MNLRILLAGIISALTTTAYAQERCGTVAECAQKSMEAAYQAKIALQIAAPKGAVMAFNLEKCPDGWTSFPSLNGRFVLGAGQGEGLKDRKLNDKGGEEDHRLTSEEMPSHSHKYTFSSGQNSPGHPDFSPNEFGYKDQENNTSNAGGDKPHNNMPPYHVLLFCERK